MKANTSFALCVLLAAVAMTVAIPARRQRQIASDKDNAIDMDGVRSGDNTIDSTTKPEDITDPSNPEMTTSSAPEANPALTLPPRPVDDSEEDSDEDDRMEASSSNSRGSNLFSLLNVVGQLFPGSSGSNMRVRRLFQNFIFKNPAAIASMERYINNMFAAKRRQLFVVKRKNSSDNEIEIDEDVSNISEQSSEEKQSSEEESNEQNSNGDSKEKSEQKSGERKSQEIEEVDNNAAEVSGEVADEKQSDEEESSSDSGDYDEPPGGGDGEGGGILGIIAGLSGGEDGQSDLGSLLATVSGIVIQLSGDGVDVNGLIASALGLFVGLLSEGMENPGSIVASYLNTAIDTLSGGGSKNNGAFFGNFAGRLLSGLSAKPEDDERTGGAGGSDSAGFFLSLLASFSGASSGKGGGMEGDE